jgi:hypothetical protein
MDVDLADETSQRTHFNGALPLERPRTELTTTNRDAAQLQRRKEAEKAYGRGRKIQGIYLVAVIYVLTSPTFSSASGSHPVQD